MSREKREVIKAIDIHGDINLQGQYANIHQVRELEADYTKLQEDLSKAVELLKEIVSVEKYIIKKVSILGAIVSLAKDFLNQLEEKG